MAFGNGFLAGLPVDRRFSGLNANKARSLVDLLKVLGPDRGKFGRVPQFRRPAPTRFNGLGAFGGFGGGGDFLNLQGAFRQPALGRLPAVNVPGPVGVPNRRSFGPNFPRPDPFPQPRFLGSLQNGQFDPVTFAPRNIGGAFRQPALRNLGGGFGF
jgi:hypothetical protein